MTGPRFPALTVWTLLAGLAIGAIYLGVGFRGGEALNRSQAILGLDLGQAARRLAEGDGFVTGFIRPVSLRYSAETSVHPELANPPLYLLVLAAAFLVLGATDAVLVLPAVVFLLLAAGAAFRLASRTFAYPAAALAVFLVLINPVLLEEVLAAGPGTCTAFLATGFLLALERARRSRAWSAAAGVLVGLGYLAEYSSGFWLVSGLVLLALSPRSGRPARLALFGLGALGAASPWLIRNFLVVGNPFFSLSGFRIYMFSPSSPGHLLWRGFSSQSLLVDEKFLVILRKFLIGIRDIWFTVLFFTGNAAAILALGSLMAGFRDRAARLRLAFLLLLAGGVLSRAVFSPSADPLLPLVPAGLVLGVGTFFELSARLSRRARGGAAAVLVILCFIPLSRPFLPGPGEATRIYDVANIRRVADAVNEDGLVVSDIPWAVAWYGGKNSLWLPARVGDYEEIGLVHSPPIEAFYATGFYFSGYFSSEEMGGGWQRILTSGWLPGGWNLNSRTILEGGQLLLTADPLPPEADSSARLGEIKEEP